MSVHSKHCCIIHGCKYGDDDCPVENGIEIQDYPCESCDVASEGWNLISDGNLPRIPEGKYGISVDVIEFDPHYSKSPNKNLSIDVISYAKIHDREGKIFPEFKGSIYDIEGKTEAFMTLYIHGKGGSSWGPIHEQIIAWRYRPKPNFLTMEVIEETKRCNET